MTSALKPHFACLASEKILKIRVERNIKCRIRIWKIPIGLACLAIGQVEKGLMYNKVALENSSNCLSTFVPRTRIRILFFIPWPCLLWICFGIDLGWTKFDSN